MATVQAGKQVPANSKAKMASAKYGKCQLAGEPAWDGDVLRCSWVVVDLGASHPRKCAQTFATNDELRKHLVDGHARAVKSEDGRRVCGWSDCGQSLTNLPRHLGVHAGVRNYPCTYAGCAQTFAAKQKLQKHEQTHTNSLFMCPGCERGFSTEQRRNEHKAAVHEAKVHPCPVEGCQYTDADSSNLSKHKKKSHAEGAPVCWCGYKDAVFVPSARLQRLRPNLRSGMWGHVTLNHPETVGQRDEYEWHFEEQKKGGSRGWNLSAHTLQAAAPAPVDVLAPVSAPAVGSWPAEVSNLDPALAFAPITPLDANAIFLPTAGHTSLESTQDFAATTFPVKGLSSSSASTQAPPPFTDPFVDEFIDLGLDPSFSIDQLFPELLDGRNNNGSSFDATMDM